MKTVFIGFIKKNILREITLFPPMVCMKNILLTCDLKIGTYPLDINFVCLSLPTFVKNKAKFVFLLHFYVHFFQNIKN